MTLQEEHSVVTTLALTGNSVSARRIEWVLLSGPSHLVADAGFPPFEFWELVVIQLQSKSERELFATG